MILFTFIYFHIWSNDVNFTSDWKNWFFYFAFFSFFLFCELYFQYNSPSLCAIFFQFFPGFSFINFSINAAPCHVYHANRWTRNMNGRMDFLFFNAIVNYFLTKSCTCIYNFLYTKSRKKFFPVPIFGIFYSRLESRLFRSSMKISLRKVLAIT